MTPDPRLALVTAAIHMTRHARHPHYCRCDEFARAVLMALAPDENAQVRVEWGVRWDEVVEQVDVDPTQRPDIGYYPGGTLVRRTVTTGEWTEVAGDE